MEDVWLFALAQRHAPSARFFIRMLTISTGLKSQYRARRNDFMDLFLAQEGSALDSRLTPEGIIEMRVAKKRSPFSEKWSSRYASDEKPNPVLFSFIPPEGGMFRK